MSFVIGILTVVLVALCAFLILLVLVQLPKKDAGVGMAFGGGAADALFGAGSGNALTKITKYTAVAFLALALVLGWMQGPTANSTAADFTRAVDSHQQQAPIAPPPQTKPQTTPANGLLPMTVPSASNAPARVPVEAPAPAGTNSPK
jgi:preprotein translocase subunit SecG